MIYVLQCQAWVKVGYSGDEKLLKKRLDGLRGSNPITTKLLATGPGDEAREDALHDRLAEWHRHGHGKEWFTICDAVLAILRAEGFNLAPIDQAALLRGTIDDYHEHACAIFEHIERSCEILREQIAFLERTRHLVEPDNLAARDVDERDAAERDADEPP